MIRTTLEKAERVIATLEHFEGDVQAWKDAIYELWRYQMTLSFAHEITVRESRNGVFIDLLIKPSYKDPLLSTMATLGFDKVDVWEEKVALVDECSLPEDCYTITTA